MSPTFGLFVLMGLLWKFIILAVPLSLLIGVIAFFGFRFLLRKQPNKVFPLHFAPIVPTATCRWVK